MYTEYDTNDYESESRNKKRLNINLGKSKYLIIIVIIILIIVGYNYLQSNSYFEKKMIKVAKNYITNNYISTNNEIFISMQELNLNRNNCDDIRSGIFYNSNNEYQAYLYCNDYKTDIMHNNQNYHLNGGDVFFLAKGINYVEPGINNVDNYLVDGSIGKEDGIYYLNYQINDISLTRKVVVIDNEYLKSLFPSISLNGDNIVYLLEGFVYNDLGVNAHDVNDGDLTGKVVIEGHVDTQVEGEYHLKYIVTNSNGYSNMVERTVTIVNDFSRTVITTYKDNKNPTNGNVIVSISIIGDEYNHILLPDGTSSYEKELSYTISDNGTYNFIGYDNDGSKIIKVLSVNNIDRTLPTGTCVATVYQNYVDIKANSTNRDKTISGYKYYVENSSTDFFNSNTYRFNYNQTSDKVTVNVELKDSLGNISKVGCIVNYSDPTIGNKNVKYYTYDGVEYVIPVTKNDLDTFVSRVKNKISQSADTAECGGACLSFAVYHAGYLKYGDLSGLNLFNACHYNYGNVVKATTVNYGMTDADRKKMFADVYKEIFSGKPVVLQVTGTSARNSRHFVTVVGYKRSVKNANSLEEEDLLVIDSWNGGFKTLSRADTKKRTTFNDKGRKTGYRLDFINPR